MSLMRKCYLREQRFMPGLSSRDLSKIDEAQTRNILELTVRTIHTLCEVLTTMHSTQLLTKCIPYCSTTV